MSFLAVLNRLDVLIDRVEKLILAITGVPAVPGVPALPPTVLIEKVIPRPLGTTKEKGHGTTTASYATIVSFTVTNGMTFHPCKVVVSCKEDVMFKLLWDRADISIEYYVMGKLPFTDWFPWDWEPCVGDGTKKFELQVKYPSGGIAADCQAEICGEEV